MNATAAAASFVWDNNFKNHEQVRPYMSDFLAVKAEITAAGQYPYNDSFKGKIPGLLNSANEDTGIYMLQNLARLDEDAAKVAAFLASGGYRLTDRIPAPNERGTLVRTGWYMGGTGYATHENVIIKTDDISRVCFKFPRQKNWRTHYEGPTGYLFKPNIDK